MANVNLVTLIGRLGAAPELNTLDSGRSKCKFGLATNRRRKNSEGDWEEATDWHRVVAWGKLADVCAKYLYKGREAYVEGRLQTDTFEGRDGRSRTITEIVASSVQFIGPNTGPHKTLTANQEG